jgi:hypothetical protein
MGPSDYTRADERILDDIHERLTQSHHIDARNILVDVNQGNVTLTGTVIERRMRYLAEDLVEGVMGVDNINNQLKVQNGNTTTNNREPPGTREIRAIDCARARRAGSATFMPPKFRPRRLRGGAVAFAREAVADRARGDPQRGRGATAVVAEVLQRLAQDVAFHFLERGADREGDRVRRFAQRALRHGLYRRHAHLAILGQDVGALHGVAQFAHVAGPRRVADQRARFRRERVLRVAARVEVGEEGIGQQAASSPRSRSGATGMAKPHRR